MSGLYKYDRTITLFSPGGRLHQVEYAQRAAMSGLIAIGICGEDSVVLAVDKGSTAELQEGRVIKRINLLDKHVMMTYSGLSADAHILMDRARTECQSHKIMVEDPVSVEYISRYIANMQQRYTQSNGRRPFGVSTLIAGFNNDGTPRLFQTDPSGSYHEWKANSIGKDSKKVSEYLVKNYSPETTSNDDLAIKLAVGALMQVIEEINLEIAVIKRDQPVRMLEEYEILAYVFFAIQGLTVEE